jgi:hypothetical protein
MRDPNVTRRLGARLAPVVLGFCGLTIGTHWAAAELVDDLPINYSLQAGDSPQEMDGPTVVANDFSNAAFGLFQTIDQDATPVDVSAHGGGENEPLLTTTDAELSIAVLVLAPDDSDLPGNEPVPVRISGSYSLAADGQGGAGVRVGDNATEGGFGGSFLFGASCSGDAPEACGGGTYSEEAEFLPENFYSFVLSAGGQVGEDPEGVTGGGFYTAEIDPDISIDNSSGLFTGYRLEIGVARIPTSVPEPATWALMAGGFAALGAMMRLRRLRAA